MKIGLHTGPQRCTFDDLRRLWRIAEDTGFHQVSVWDHFYDDPSAVGDGPNFEAVATLAALASETERVRIVVYAFCVGYRHPAVLANAAVTIDHISNGRFEIGLGAGWLEKEYRAYGIPFPPVGVRMDILEESVQIIRSMFQDERTNFRGAHFTMTDAICQPKPVQKRLPIWVCGGGEKRTLRMAARYGDKWNIPYPSPEVFKQKNAVLDEWCDKEGRDGGEILRSANVGLFLGANQAEAKKKRAQFEKMFGERAPVQAGGMLIGTPSEATDRIGEYVDAGAQNVNVVMRAPFDFDGLQLFVEEVKPAFE
ncbi:MAG: TIGR03560 family F420-dependent LLM class oxidoreductase [SAR202 cluster bacterium]|nr:TIGR03560 family F420-dependent LLM class oxidoreductase [SAR202 cluster bacterium]